MSAAIAEAVTNVPNPAVMNAAAVPETDIIGGIQVPQDLMAEAQAGAQRILQMSPDDLRGLIAKRVRMLDTELHEREARRAAIEEAMVAQRVLGARRQRARRLRRKVNIGSSVVAAMFCGMVFINMF